MSTRPSGLYDAAVLGAGPAGIATAIRLAQLGRRVIVFERSRFEGPRFGETFGPEIQPLLMEIGAWESFAATPLVPFRAVYSAWGGPELMERPSIAHPLGEGWLVDRAAVDRAVASAAASSVELLTGTSYCTVTRGPGLHWTIAAASSAETPVEARFLVDASGRGGPALASFLPERQWRKSDRLVAAHARFVPRVEGSEAGELLLESSPDGWWYSVPQPNGGLLATFMTDADLISSGDRTSAETFWRASLSRTVYTAARVAGYGPMAESGIRTVRSDSGYLEPSAGDGWIATGDAAMACDPLSGTGYARSLRSGLETADIVHRLLDGHAVEPSPSIRERFETFTATQARYYSMEGRWPDSPFWARRLGLDQSQ